MNVIMNSATALSRAYGCNRGTLLTRRGECIVRSWRGIAKTGIPKTINYLTQSCLYFANLVRLGNSLL